MFTMQYMMNVYYAVNHGCLLGKAALRNGAVPMNSSQSSLPCTAGAGVSPTKAFGTMTGLHEVSEVMDLSTLTSGARRREGEERMVYQRNSLPVQCAGTVRESIVEPPCGD